ncbi:MAG TPA: lyase family protein [Candidatus Saccharimonadales bacterium]|nr:lyase family protein [Candidatus Saccharimonadales bacterium]
MKDITLKPFVLPSPAPPEGYGNIDPLDGRYFDVETARYLSEQARVTFQAYVEAALAHTLAQYGICSHKDAEAIEASARKVKTAAVYEEEKSTKHDVKALVNCIKQGTPAYARPYVHFGATSYDIVATASALQMRAAMQEVVIPRLKRLLQTLVAITESYATTVQIGRTHGQHAVPITFGFAVSEYVNRLGESTVVLELLLEQLRGKFSGAVGAYNALSMFVDDPLAFEQDVLARVGLEPAPFSTQIVPPEPTVRLLDELTVTAGIMANLAHDMRHLQRSEIAEVRERFEKGQTGSSTMAHKRNPWNFENIVSIAKQVTAQSVNAHLNLSSEHQRDLTDSASGRFYPIVLACVASMADRLNTVMSKLEIDPDAMERNLRLSGGVIAAEPLYLLLTKYGHPSAHEASKELAHRALEAGTPLHQAIVEDPVLAGYWDRFAEEEQVLLKEPEARYTGIAAAKAKALARHWKRVLRKGP